MKKKRSYNFFLLSLAMLTLCYSNGIAFYTHLCSSSKQISFSISGVDPCNIENKSHLSSNHTPTIMAEDCCKINFIFFKLKEDYLQQHINKTLPSIVELSLSHFISYCIPQISFEQNNGRLYKNPPPLQRFNCFPKLNILHQSFLC